MAKAVQSHPPSPSPKHKTASSRNSIKKWYLIWGLDTGEAIIIVLGGGITAENVAHISKATGAKEFHASCSVVKNSLSPNMFTKTTQRHTSADIVRQVKTALRDTGFLSD